MHVKFIDLSPVKSLILHQYFTNISNISNISGILFLENILAVVIPGILAAYLFQQIENTKGWVKTSPHCRQELRTDFRNYIVCFAFVILVTEQDLKF